MEIMSENIKLSRIFWPCAKTIKVSDLCHLRSAGVFAFYLEIDVRRKAKRSNDCCNNETYHAAIRFCLKYVNKLIITEFLIFKFNLRNRLEIAHNCYFHLVPFQTKNFSVVLVILIWFITTEAITFNCITQQARVHLGSL